MEEWCRKVRINGEEPARSLAIDPFSNAHHFAGKLELVFLGAYMFNGGIRKSQVKRFVGKWHVAAGTHHVIESFSVLREENVEDRDPVGSANDRPRIVLSSNVKDRSAGPILQKKILEAAPAEVLPHGHLEIDRVHEWGAILYEAVRAARDRGVLAMERIYWCGFLKNSGSHPHENRH